MMDFDIFFLSGIPFLTLRSLRFRIRICIRLNMLNLKNIWLGIKFPKGEFLYLLNPQFYDTFLFTFLMMQKAITRNLHWKAFFQRKWKANQVAEKYRKEAVNVDINRIRDLIFSHVYQSFLFIWNSFIFLSYIHIFFYSIQFSSSRHGNFHFLHIIQQLYLFYVSRIIYSLYIFPIWKRRKEKSFFYFRFIRLVQN